MHSRRGRAQALNSVLGSANSCRPVQLADLTFNQGVVGSSLAAITNLINMLAEKAGMNIGIMAFRYALGKQAKGTDRKQHDPRCRPV
jgi:hypothetical protein